MREIKFRIFDTAEKKMCSVARVSFGDDGAALTVLAEPAPVGEFYRGLVNGESGILMQFTGLKDKNGKEVYEGDIVLVNEKEKCAITFHIGNMGFVLDTDPLKADAEAKRFSEASLHDLAIKGFSARIEVIGNIYENPELLKA